MQTRINLAQGVAARVLLQRGDSLVCRQGQLWLSSDGQDIVLTPGQRYLAGAREELVIEALPAGSCIVERPGLAGGLLRLLRRLPRMRSGFPSYPRGEAR